MTTNTKTLLVGAAFAVAATLAAGAANAASIVNGSFENGVDPGSFVTLGHNSTGIDGWIVKGNGVDYVGNYWQAADGLRSVDLSALNGGSIQQTIATVVGQAYKVSFWLAGNPDGGLGDKFVATSVSGDWVNSFTFNVGASNTKENMGWKEFSYTFTAFDTSSTLVFNSQTHTPFGPALDNVSISSAVPEPATWAMMIIGFGGVGGMVRSSRRKQALAFA